MYVAQTFFFTWNFATHYLVSPNQSFRKRSESDSDFNVGSDPEIKFFLSFILNKKGRRFGSAIFNGTESDLKIWDISTI